MQPALFLPHGAPDLALSQIPAAQFLQGLFEDRPLPKGIVIISAHWESPGLQLTTAPQLETIHDFGGFGPALHALHYPAKTASWVIDATKQALNAGGIEAEDNWQRGLDHGAWIPLMLALPKADIPVVQLSLPYGSTPEALFYLGQALSELAHQDILVIGSGATVHNLRKIAPEGSKTPGWATGFDDWIENVLIAQDWAALFQFRNSEFGRISHPTPEHFLPLLVVAGICDARSRSVMKTIHRSYSYGSIGMAAWEVCDAI